MLIDIGGTPEKIIEDKKLELAKANGILQEQLIAILDPFDLSRAQRTINYKGKKIKFPINSKEVELNSEKEPVVISKKWPDEIKEVANYSSNIRELMNNLVLFFYPNLKIIKLEEVLSKNKDKVYNILTKTKIPVRAICPKCNKFRKTVLGNNSMCCNLNDKEIINSGKYIPQNGFLSAITYLCGYRTFSNDKEKAIQLEEIRKKLRFKGNPLVNYIKEDKLNITFKKEGNEENKMSEIKECVKGFQDISGNEAKKKEKIKEILIRIFRLYGFEPAETPIIEYEEFVKGENAGDEAISDIFRLKDKGGRNIALRYEFTFQLKRLAQNKKLPYKRYQIGEVFRDEPVSANRFRQFTQCDADIVGSSIKDEAEILALASRIFKELGIQITININNRKLLNEILEKEGIKEKDRQEVIKEIDKLDKLPESQVSSNLQKYKAEKILKIFKEKEKFFEKYNSFREIKELREYCKPYGINLNFQPSLARGLSYYNGNIFEIKTAGMKETISGGGSYLVNEIQSTGISFGLDRVIGLAKVELEEKEILVLSIGQDEKAMKLAERLRNQSLACKIMYGKPTKALEYANSQRIPYVIFIGEEEVKKRSFKLRNMKTGKETMLEEKELIKKLEGENFTSPQTL
jgi:histidyl-tRNA synthetase